ncbi:MAG: glycosyltransferase [Deltaproteobacteria bacterium]|nr:glycosyltransferase [Deltaproteobacteria bacterium]
MTDKSTTDSSKPPVKVLELIARLNIGGPAVLVIDLAAGLTGRDFEVKLAAGRVGPGEAQMDFWANSRGQGNLAAFKEIVRLLRQTSPHILHTHTAKAGALGRLAGMSLGRGRPRMIHTFHGHVFSGYFSPLKTRLFIFIERFLARKTDRVVVLSEEQAEEICRLYRICGRDKISVIPVGLDLEPFQAARPGGLRESLGIGPDVFLIGFIGRLTKIKDPLTLLRALVRVSGQTEQPVGLVIVGQGELEREVRAEAGRLGLKDVHFLGWQEGAAEIYPDLDLLALTSVNEGLPLVLIEALAAGRPVVSTPVGGVPELLGLTDRPGPGRFAQAQRGLFFQTGDISGLTQAIKWAITHYKAALELAQAGQDYVASRHSREGFLQAHAELYRSLAPESQ